MQDPEPEVDREARITGYAEALLWALENEELIKDELIKAFVQKLKCIMEEQEKLGMQLVL